MLTSFDKSRFYVAQQYIQASTNMIERMLEAENRSVVVSDHPISEHELIEGTKNGSQSIILPMLFCLYQGIELLLKGFVYIKCQTKNAHDVETLCKIK